MTSISLDLCTPQNTAHVSKLVPVQNIFFCSRKGRSRKYEELEHLKEPFFLESRTEIKMTN